MGVSVVDLHRGGWWDGWRQHRDLCQLRSRSSSIGFPMDGACLAASPAVQAELHIDISAISVTFCNSVYRPKASIVSNRLWLACGERLTAKHRDRPFSDQVRFPLNQLLHIASVQTISRCWSTCLNQIYGGWLVRWSWPDMVPPK